MLRTTKPDTIGRNRTAYEVNAIKQGLADVVGYTELHPDIVKKIESNTASIESFNFKLTSFGYIIDQIKDFRM